MRWYFFLRSPTQTKNSTKKNFSSGSGPSSVWPEFYSVLETSNFGACQNSADGEEWDAANMHLLPSRIKITNINGASLLSTIRRCFHCFAQNGRVGTGEKQKQKRTTNGSAMLVKQNKEFSSSVHSLAIPLYLFRVHFSCFPFIWLRLQRDLDSASFVSTHFCG